LSHESLHFLGPLEHCGNGTAADTARGTPLRAAKDFADLQKAIENARLPAEFGEQRPGRRQGGRDRWRAVGEFVVARLSGNLISRWPRGEGHPVLVIPGFLAGGASTQVLRDALRALGYRAYDWRLGYNLGFRSSMID
jgi:hypothetical protein